MPTEQDAKGLAATYSVVDGAAGELAREILRLEAELLAAQEREKALREDQLEALLAVVEAAKDVRVQQEGVGSEVLDIAVVSKAAMYRLRDALDALNTPDSVESKDAKGAKP